MSTVRANNILDAAGGNTATINGMTPTAQSLQGFRNRIINGDMRIDQRNNGASVTINTASVVYTVDRAYSFVLGAACTAQRISSGRTDFPFALRVTGAASNTYVEVGQRIESFNCTDLVGGSVTVSFLAARSSGTSVTVRLSYANTTDGHIGGVTTIGTQMVTISSTLAQYTVTFNSLLSQTANGLQIGFEFGAVGSGQTVTVTGVQLEAGSVATPFERRDYGRELMMCQRYYYRNSQSGAPTGSLGFGVSVSTTQSDIQVQSPVTMRSAPTLAFGGSPIVTDSIGYNLSVGSIAIQYGNPQNVRAFFNHAATATVRSPATLSHISGTSAYIELTAEL